MLIPSPKELQLLALVAVREQSGREVARLYREETGRSISYGTVYTTFRRLKEAGWVLSRDDQDADGRIRLFRITGKGEMVLARGRRHYEALARFALSPLTGIL